MFMTGTRETESSHTAQSKCLGITPNMVVTPSYVDVPASLDPKEVKYKKGSND
jgi:hypothetical protein